MSFPDFFAEATGGLAPFAYQQRIATGGIPRLLNAPTGAGKSAAAVLGWLWRRRFHPDQAIRQATPRRLVYCLPMRVLVEQTRQNAATWLGNLGLLEEIPVHTLMGGEVALDWDQQPESDSILVGTQDQLLSRALNRGYAMSRYRWPVQFGLLNSDCLWVLDEVQLMGPGLGTSVQLDAFRQALGRFGPCQSMWMSATLRRDALTTIDAPEWPHPMTLSDDDLRCPGLAERVSARKACEPLEVTDGKTRAKDLARRVIEAHRPGSLSLVIVNTVRRAQEVAQALGRGQPRRGGPECLLLHSSFRPPDRARALEAILSPVDPQSPGRIVVSTQAVEAGVDLSARTLVTELAPWPSLVQRFGRCNRRGEFGDARVLWVDVPPKQAAPYDAGALDLARGYLTGLADVGIRHVEAVRDATPLPTHPLLRRPDILDLYDTTPDLSGQDVDVSVYIREAEDHDVSVFWRELDDAAPVPDLAVPEPHELCPVSITRVQDFIKKSASAFRWDALGARWAPVRPESLRPGQVILLPTDAGGYDTDLGWWEKAKPPVPSVAVPNAAANEAYADDPLTSQMLPITLADHTDDVVGEVAARLDALAELDGLPPAARDALLRAARWHDAGKAHPAFQGWLRGPDPGDDSAILAKGPPAAGAGAIERKHFRHELASALAAVACGEAFLTAYLAACHHGKVRLSIRSLPDERFPSDLGTRFARGVWDGDELPEADLGGGVTMPATRLCLACMELGLSDAGEPSWLERSLGLLSDYGPFRLAYLEALLRVSDWAASARQGGHGDGQ